MRYRISSLLGIAVAGSIFCLSTAAEAQMQPGGMPMGGPGGGTQPAGEAKKEGVAEAAPKAPGLLPTTPALPSSRGKRKKWKLIELDGYYRVRTDYFKNFNLGFIDDDTIGGSPFPRPLGCTPAATGSLGNVTGRPCGNTLAGTNMRLRLEPTINLDEGTSIHIQADALDNVLFGSTPSGLDLSGVFDNTNKPPVGAFGNTQTAPTRGLTSNNDSFVVKRAWAEIALPIGILKVGRQPNHWGMGIYSNGGGYNPMDGTYNWDADFGDTVDRLSFSAQIPGTQLRAMVAVDWDMTRLVSNQTSEQKAYSGHPFDLDDNDDATSFIGVISKLDSPTEFRDIVDRGELAFDYGVYFEYKSQNFDDDLTGFTEGGNFDPTTRYVPRDLKTYTPDVWAKLGYGAIQLEGEFVAQLGRVNHLDDAGLVGNADIRKFGGVGKLTWRGVENKLALGIESGFASGDQWDNTIQGRTNIAFANTLGGQGDKTLSQFIFNRDYFVDMIMFRHLIGAVTNTAYGKPFIGYDLTKNISFRAWNVTAFALKPIATPGNGRAYGTEFDTDLTYHQGGLSAGIGAGVLFPFGAMSHPDDSTLAGGAGFGYGTNAAGQSNVGDPSTAYAITTHLVLQF